ncbi:MAG: Uma2 family endonuclease [Myxococcales bacterium]|nr:Uma2 family endonuclease [Myxococcales bacterium]
MLDPAVLAVVGPERIRGLNREQFEGLIKLGVFADQHVELLRGVLVEMTVQEEPHARISAWFHKVLVRGLDDHFEIRGHSSFAATEDSVPEPDIAVYAMELRTRLPREALLLVEVADTSLAKDRKIKTEIYAEAGVPEYWIANVRAHRVEVHTRPGPDGYSDVRTYAGDEVLRPASLHPFELRVSDVPWEPQERPAAKKQR